MRCYLYLVLASDGSLYTGISEDPERRLRDHNRGRGAKALRGKRPVSLLCQFRCTTRGEALRLELRVKRLRAPEKWSLALGNAADPLPARP